MVDYKSYINALKQCAKEHKNDYIPFANIRTTDLCNDTADLLERLESGINTAIEEMERSSIAADYEDKKEISKAIDKCVEIFEDNMGE